MLLDTLGKTTNPKYTLSLPLFIESKDINSIDWDNIKLGEDVPKELYLPRTLEDLRNITLSSILAYIEERNVRNMQLVAENVPKDQSGEASYESRLKAYENLGKEYLRGEIIVKTPRDTDGGFNGIVSFQTSRSEHDIEYGYRLFEAGNRTNEVLTDSSFVVACRREPDETTRYIFITKSREAELKTTYREYLNRNGFEVIAYVERLPSDQQL